MFTVQANSTFTSQTYFASVNWGAVTSSLHLLGNFSFFAKKSVV